MVRRFEDILERVQDYNPDADLDLLRKAYIFSAREHRDQVRRSGEPYLVHPLEVSYLLAELRLDTASIVAGLLHDVVEDTLTTEDNVSEYFGKDVAHIVAGVTKISKLKFASDHEAQAQNLRKMILAMVDDIRVILVKLTDRVHNMRTLHHLPPAKQQRIARETREIYAPIAHRLGIGRRGTVPPGEILRYRPAYISWLAGSTGVKSATSLPGDSNPADPTAPGPWSDDAGAPAGAVSDFQVTEDRALWAAADDNGAGQLWRCTGETWTLALDALPPIHCLEEDGQHLLVGTETGLLVMDLYSMFGVRFRQGAAGRNEMLIHVICNHSPGICDCRHTSRGVYGA